MADGAGRGLPAAASAGDGVFFSEDLGREICARVAAGESISAVCRSPGMPFRTTINRWAERHPEFQTALGEAMLAARTAQRLEDRAVAAALAARPKPLKGGKASTYTPKKGETICRRIANGESVIAISRDPQMPCAERVYAWIKQFPEFQEAYVLARQMQADYLLDEAREVALAATPKSVWADRLRFDTIRWMTTRLAPRKYCEPILLAEAAAEVRATAAEASRVALADDRRLTVKVLSFERGPSGEILVAPPRGPKEEAAWVQAYGTPYDGPR